MARRARVTIRARRKVEVEAAYQAFILAGFPVTLEGNAETLQFASETDRSNWLIFKGLIDDAIAASVGDNVAIPIPLRCTSDNEYFVTYPQAQAIVVDMRLWGLQAQANAWRLKNLVAAATSNAELNAIDLTEGWP